MLPMKPLCFAPQEQQALVVERALSDLRRGTPVLITDTTQDHTVLFLATETLDCSNLTSLSSYLNEPFSIAITASRAQFLLQIETKQAMSIQLSGAPHRVILDAIEGSLLKPIDASILNTFGSPEPAPTLIQQALILTKLAELLPTIAWFSVNHKQLKELTNHQFLTIQADDVQTYKATLHQRLIPEIKAPLYLHGAKEATITSYRPIQGGNEHYAIVIGSPERDPAPLIRIHSSCYTGDLLYSLRCDCHDQLHDTIHVMGNYANHPTEEYHGGIILYLMQEGRGIGLTNKLRTYYLQSQGLDTVDANEHLGFDDDERVFGLAGSILKNLNIVSATLLTNNPRKAQGLEASGIEVVGTMPLITTPHEQNQDYLATKVERLGHKIDVVLHPEP